MMVEPPCSNLRKIAEFIGCPNFSGVRKFTVMTNGQQSRRRIIREKYTYNPYTSMPALMQWIIFILTLFITAKFFITSVAFA